MGKDTERKVRVLKRGRERGTNKVNDGDGKLKEYTPYAQRNSPTGVFHSIRSRPQ